MDLGTHVVCFERELLLLESRRKVLATRFHAISVTTLEGLEQSIASGPVELLVICHTVTKQDCLAAVTMASNSPHAIKTVLLILDQMPLYAPAQTIRAHEGPGRLLTRLSELLSVKRWVTDHTEGNPTTPLSSRPVQQPEKESRRGVRPDKRRSCRPQT